MADSEKKAAAKKPKKTAAKTKTANESPDKPTKKDFLIVGLGASAGGVKALQDFFASMPPNSGMAFVVVLHLDPHHESNLDHILQAHTQMPVIQVQETHKVEPNTVYVIPPDSNLEMIDGVVRLVEAGKLRGSCVAIDTLLRTLAEAYEKNAVCIVLSGTGSDGTLGLKRVKESNGFAIVQDPHDAEYEEMPRSAIATGLVDWILPVAQMPEKLLGFKESSERMHLTNGADAEKVAAEIRAEDSLREILTILKVRTGHDFSNYKTPTLIRRIARHLQIHELEDIPDYLIFLRDNPEEILSLQRNLLINVTNFFRDKEAFIALEKNVIANLFVGKSSRETVRVWSCGCASGEEAYSLAMLLSEYAETLSDPPRFQVFATDVDDEAIADAREHSYPETIEADVSRERLKRFFTKEGKRYRIKKELRETVLFAPHNVLRDPPFSKLDLITCRNLLIYLNRDTQERVMEIFHFALNLGGYLFLGSSETADGVPNLFSVLDKKHRIYARRAAHLNEQFAPPQMPIMGNWQIKIPDRKDIQTRNKAFSLGEVHYKLLEKFAPPSVLVNRDFEVMYMSETVGRYLRLTGGELSPNILKLVHPDLLPDLRAALFTAQHDKKASEFPNLRVQIDGAEVQLNLIVRVVEVGDDDREFLLVIFDEDGRSEQLPIRAKNDENKEDSPARIVSKDDAMETVLNRLEGDLNRTRGQLRATIEQNEVSVEELKAANEELQAINEELRSAGEELETSKEEAQSVNEELITVNHELKEKIDETGRVNSDLQNLMAATDIATIFLDKNLRIKRYTPPIEELFNITKVDVGRPLEHFTHKLNYDDLRTDATQVLKKLTPIEREITDQKDNSYLARFAPYRTIDDRIDGVVLNFIDISERKKTEIRLRQSEEKFVAFVGATSEIVYEMSADWSEMNFLKGKEFLASTKTTSEDWTDSYIPDAEKPSVWAAIQRSIRTKSIFELEHRVYRLDGSIGWTFSRAIPLFDAAGEIIKWFGAAQDITEQKQAAERLRASEERYRNLFISMDQAYAVVEVLQNESGKWNDFLFLEVNAAFVKQTGMEYPVGRKATELLGTPNPHWAQTYGRVVETGDPVRFEEAEPMVGRVFDLYCFRLDRESNRVAVLFNDITERKQRERQQEFLLRFSDILRTERSADLVANRALEMLIEELHLDRSYITTYYLDDDRARLDYQIGNDSVPPLPEYFVLSDYPDAFKMTFDKTLVIEDEWERQGLSEAEKRSSGNLGMRAMVAATLRKENKPIWSMVAINSQPRRWTAGEIALIEAVAERTWAAIESAKAEEALRDSESRLHSIANLVPDLLWSSEPNGWTNWYNQRWLEYTGQSFEEAIGWGWADAIHPDDCETSSRNYREAVENGEMLRQEHRIRRFDGEYRWFVVNAFPLKDQSGKVVKVYGAAMDIHESREMHEALSKSEEKYRTLFDSIDEGFCIVEVYFDNKGKPFDYRFLETNPAFVTQTGLENAIGSTMLELAPDHEKFWFDTYGEIALTGEAARFEHQAKALSHWYEVYAFRVGAPGENRVAILFRDIADRQKAEQSLRESEERLRIAVEAAEMATWDWDLIKNEVVWNERHFLLFGMKPSKEPQRPEAFFDHVQPNDRDWLGERLRHAIETNTAFEAEFCIIREDGKTRWMEGYGHVVEHSEGKPVRVSGVMSDITSRKSAEEAVRQSEERLNLILQSITDYAVITSDTTGIINGWNTGAENTFGWTAQEAIGQPCALIFTVEDRTARIPEREMQTALEKGIAEDSRWHIRKDGTRFFASGTVSPITNGEFDGFVKIASDQTARIEAETALHEKETLQKLVTAQEDERKRIARDLHDELGQQLTALRIKLDAVSNSQKEPVLRNQLHEIQNIARSIDDGVDFLAFELRPTSLDDLGLNAALDKYIRQWSHYSGVKVELTISDLKRTRFTPEVETCIYRIVQEALNNTHKHAKATNADIMLEKRGDLLILIVEDNGKGFNQKSKMNRTKGIGLIGMKERAELVGGTFEIETGPKQGTTIFVRIPFSAAKEK